MLPWQTNNIFIIFLNSLYVLYFFSNAFVSSKSTWGDYFITYLVPFPLPSIFTTPFLPISFSNCVVFDLPNGA